MASKIVLISNDSNFFDFIRVKLELRKSDELFLLDFDSIIENYFLYQSAIIIVNADLINFFSKKKF